MSQRSRNLLSLMLVTVFCVFMNGCGGQMKFGKPVYNDLTRSIPLRSPANFIIKVTGKTAFTYEGTEIPVGAILKESLEASLKQIENFTSDNDAGSQYIIGLDIIEYDPKFDAKEVVIDKLKTTAKDVGGKLLGTNFWSAEEDANVGNIVCDVSLYTVKTNKKGEQIIGDKLMLFTEAFVAGESLDKYNILNLGEFALKFLPVNATAVLAAKGAAETADVVASINAAETMIKGCGFKISKVLEEEFKK